MNREQWLTQAAAVIAHTYEPEFADQFGDTGAEHLRNVKVSAGWPSVQGLTKRIGECWSSSSAADGTTHHIFISPKLIDPVEVLATLAHELIHAADDGKSGHKGKFTRCARAIGLEGKPTATHAGEAFIEWAKGVAGEVGEYPHVELKPTMKKKKQGTRMIKVTADCCGYVARTTRTWLDIGPLSCPCGTPMAEA